MPEKKTHKRAKAQDPRWTKASGGRTASFFATGSWMADTFTQAIVSGARRVGIDLSRRASRAPETRAADLPEHPTPMERVFISSRALHGERVPSPGATRGREAASRKSTGARKAARKSSSTRKSTKGERRGAATGSAGPSRSKTGTSRGSSTRKASTRKASTKTTATKRTSATKRKGGSKRTSSARRPPQRSGARHAKG